MIQTEITERGRMSISQPGILRVDDGPALLAGTFINVPVFGKEGSGEIFRIMFIQL